MGLRPNAWLLESSPECGFRRARAAANHNRLRGLMAIPSKIELDKLSIEGRVQYAAACPLLIKDQVPAAAKEATDQAIAIALGGPQVTDGEADNAAEDVLVASGKSTNGASRAVSRATACRAAEIRHRTAGVTVDATQAVTDFAYEAGLEALNQDLSLEAAIRDAFKRSSTILPKQ